MNPFTLRNFASRIPACFLMLTLVTIKAFGFSYSGTITETVTFTDDPSFHVGQTFVGSYQYESATSDGDFGAPWYTEFNPSALPTLRFSLFTFLPIGLDGWLSIEESNYQEFTHLVVTDNVVTDFFLTGQYGAADPNFRLTEFYIPNGLVIVDGAARSTFTAGTMSFSAPVPVPEGSTTTVGLVAFGFLGIAFFRQRLLR